MCKRTKTCSSFLLILILSVLASLGFSQKPNIIVIITDDVGWNDFSFHGSDQIQTPNIDALGYHGAFLQRHYTNQVCTPSRAALLTGKYAMRLGYQGYPMGVGLNRSIPHDVATLPQTLKNLGYRTHLVGKWHLGHGKKSSTPLGYGFDTHYGYWNGYIGYFDHKISKYDVYNGTDLHDQYAPVIDKEGVYATDLFTEKAIEIINNHPKDEPIYMQFAHLAGHTGKTIRGTETVLEVHNITATNENYHFISEERRRMLAEIIERMDQSVGNVIEALAINNMLQNSIIVFFSDNGGPTYGQHSNSASNYPLRGIKASLHEGAVRTPSLIYSPLLKNKGRIYDELFHITDWVPTLVTAAGGDISTMGKIDGINHWQNIVKNNNTQLRKEIFLDLDPTYEYSAIIDGHYKLVNNSYFNYNYTGDPGFQRINKNLYYQNIKNSTTNFYLEKNGNHNLQKSQVTNLREHLVLHCSKRPVDIKPCTGKCLFNLKYDPCESTDISKLRPDLVRKMFKKIEFYKDQAKFKPEDIFDSKSDPALCNKTWFNWLDKTDACWFDNNKNIVKQKIMS